MRGFGFPLNVTYFFCIILEVGVQGDRLLERGLDFS
jgi:hypothetical protein